MKTSFQCWQQWFYCQNAISMKLALIVPGARTWCIVLPQEQWDKLAVPVSLTLVPRVLLQIL